MDLYMSAGTARSPQWTVRPPQGLNLQEIQLGVGKESQIFSELESPGDMDSDFSGGRGKDPVTDVVLWR
jgi:hypothetical protein